MKMRQPAIRIGGSVRTRSSRQHGLPAGLPADADVTIVDHDAKSEESVVRDGSGREWKVNTTHNIDPGVEYLLGARWLPADHPLVLHELQKVLGQKSDAP